MANLNYLDFELCFEQHDSGYRVKVLRSPVDEQASVDFKLPFISAEQAELPVSAANVWEKANRVTSYNLCR